MKITQFGALTLVLTLPLLGAVGCAWQYEVDALKKEVSSMRSNVETMRAESTARWEQSMGAATAALQSAERAANAAQKAGTAAESANLTIVKLLERPALTEYTLEFGTNKASVNYAMGRQLDEILRDWKDKAAEFQVVGYADMVGSAKYNLMLSQKRALEVKAALVRRGVQPSLVRAVGVGEEFAAVETKDGSRLRTNRRVVLTVLPKKG